MDQAEQLRNVIKLHNQKNLWKTIVMPFSECM